MTNFDTKFPGAVTFMTMGGYGHAYTTGADYQQQKLTAVVNNSSGDITVSYDVDCRSDGVVLQHNNKVLPPGGQIVGYLQNFRVISGGEALVYFQKGEAPSP